MRANGISEGLMKIGRFPRTKTWAPLTFIGEGLENLPKETLQNNPENAALWKPGEKHVSRKK